MAKQKFASMDPDTFSEGSGLFDDVDGTLVSILYGTEAPEGYETDGNPLFATVTLLLDGEGSETDRTVQQSYSLGGKSGDNFTIGDGGSGLIPASDHAVLNKSTKYATFIEALKKEGISATVLATGDMSVLTGLYGHWNRTADKERKGLKNARASKFPATTLVLTKIHSLPGGKAAGKATKAAAAVADAAPVVDGDAPTLDDACSTYLLDILASKDGKVQRSQLALLASKVALKDPRRLDISKRMADEEFLSTNLAWVYDPASKGQLVTA